MEHIKEILGNNIFLKLDSAEDYSYFELMKVIRAWHDCADGYFYDPYTKTYLKGHAADYTLYIDANGNRLSPPVEVKVI